MFKNLSWENYCLIVSIVLGIYYSIICFKYYSNELMQVVTIIVKRNFKRDRDLNAAKKAVQQDTKIIDGDNDAEKLSKEQQP